MDHRSDNSLDHWPQANNQQDGKHPLSGVFLSGPLENASPVVMNTGRKGLHRSARVEVTYLMHLMSDSSIKMSYSGFL